MEFLRWDNFIRVDPAVPQGCTQPYGMELVVGTLAFVPFVQGMCGAGNMLGKAGEGFHASLVVLVQRGEEVQPTRD